MKLSEINIRDPFILKEGGKYYLYGTRAKDFGCGVAGFDVYTSENLDDWSSPEVCFDSEAAGLNKEVNWAPEVHRYKGRFYMFATFTKENGLRGTYALVSDSPSGPFVLHSHGALTPYDWECLDGTLYIDKKGEPYLVFCHEHTQVIDGTVCYIRLNEELTESIGEAVCIFSGSSPYYIEEKPEGEHYITDGPFMYRTKSGALVMIWSTFINHKYSQCIAKSDNGDITGEFVHLAPIITDDGGHGMLFEADGRLLLTFHTPNKSLEEHPTLIELRDAGDTLIRLR